MDAKISTSHWSDPDLQPLSPEMLLTLLWVKTNPDRNDIGAYRFTPTIFTFQTKLDAIWHEKTRAALALRFAQDGHWFVYLPFIRECLQLGPVIGKNLCLNKGWQALAKPFQALSNPLQGLVIDEYPELREVVHKSFVSNHINGFVTTTGTKPLEGLGIPSEGAEQSSIDQNRSEQGECEGKPAELVAGTLIPTEEEVLEFCRTFQDLARGLSTIPEAYALSWFSWRSEPRAGVFPRDWKGDLRRRYVSSVLDKKTAPIRTPLKTAQSERLESLRRTVNDPRSTPQERVQARAELAEAEALNANPLSPVPAGA